jgi:hypothetical protein
MSARFDHFGATALGQQLAGIIDGPNSYLEMRAFSREGFPAITALVSLLRDVLEPLRGSDPKLFDTAKQFCGFRVGKTMRGHGHVIVRRAARVPGRLFTVAAVWSGAPVGTGTTATAA